jgi:hypothetical protein
MLLVTVCRGGRGQLLAYWWREDHWLKEMFLHMRSVIKVEEELVGVPVKGGLYEVCNYFFVMLYHYLNESCMYHWQETSAHRETLLGILICIALFNCLLSVPFTWP